MTSFLGFVKEDLRDDSLWNDYLKFSPLAKIIFNARTPGHKDAMTQVDNKLLIIGPLCPSIFALDILRLWRNKLFKRI